jgi:hypothetical protein
MAAAFLVSCALILIQVSFSRLIGYKLFYHFVFAAISLSLLGLGAAGTYVAVTRHIFDEERRLHRWLAALIISIPIAFLLIANPFGVSHHPPIRIKLLGADAITYLLWCSPLMVWLNFCGGVVLTTLFSRYSHRMGRLYSADLLGAGIGALLCVGLMKYGSPPVAFVGATLVVGLAFLPYHLALANDDKQKKIGALAALTGAVLGAVVFLGPDKLRNFENFRAEGKDQNTSDVIKFEWNHLIRTDHLSGWYRLDGEASTEIIAWTPRERARGVSKPAYTIAPSNPVVGIIGVGGGLQLAEARRANASHITAIDINPTILGWVQNEDRELNNDLFIDPGIEIKLGEGRHMVRSSDRKFDVLVMHAIDTYAATAAGAYALSENFLYTKEAIQDYYRSLSDQGVLTISRWLFYPPRENLRLFGTVLAALRDMGVENPLDHVTVIAPVPDFTQLGDRRVWGYLLVSKPRLDAQRMARLRNHVRQRRWSFVYAPDQRTGTPFDELAQSRNLDEFQATYPYLISAVTDSNPYLFQFYNPLHKTSYSANQDWATVHIYQWSAIALLATLLIAVILSFLTIIAPLMWAKHRKSEFHDGERPAIGLRHAIYFTGLGIGFMAFEVPIIQIFSLYLGHPTFGFSVVLVSLLIASGLGSLLVDRFNLPPPTICAVIAVGLAVLTPSVFGIIHGTLGMSGPARFSIAIVILSAFGVLMGMPLALGVRRLGAEDARSVAWAWGINGVASVIGSCLVMIVMVFVGSHAALTAAALCYAISAVAARVWSGPSALPDMQRIGSNAA